jgi:hypothetical protein
MADPTLPIRVRDQGPPAGFYQTIDGQVECLLCAARDHAHTPACPVMTLDAHLRDLTGQLGLFVAAMRETTEALARLLRGDAGDARP